MNGHHVLSEMRRWLLQPDADRRLLALLIASVLIIASSLAVLTSGPGSGTERSELTQLHR